MARSTFYYYLKNSGAGNKYTSITNEIATIYNLHKGRYGYRRVTATLVHQGWIINHKTVLRIMNKNGLKGILRKRKYKSYRGTQGKIARNLLNRNFIASKPFKKLVTDVTEFSLGNKKLYLSPIMDLFNGEIISYNLSERPDFPQTIDMLNKAIAILPTKAKPILHSDQGWQYQMIQYQTLLKKNKIRQSMSRKGNCLDNAAMESFFSIIKSELFYQKEFCSIKELKHEIKKFVFYYNNYRIKMKLNGLSPVDYRIQVA